VRYACGTKERWLYGMWLQCWERLAGQGEVWCCDHTSGCVEVCVHFGQAVCKRFGGDLGNHLGTISNVDQVYATLVKSIG
jgi:hypothetical protein